MPSDEPSYANYTRNDSNLLKRWVQRRRMADAIKLAKRYGSPRLVVDYGAGDGAISAALADAFPTAEILCFEPVANLRMEAEELA